MTKVSQPKAFRNNRAQNIKKSQRKAYGKPTETLELQNNQKSQRKAYGKPTESLEPKTTKNHNGKPTESLRKAYGKPGAQSNQKS